MSSVTKSKAPQRQIRVRQVGPVAAKHLKRSRPVARKAQSIRPEDQAMMSAILKSISKVDDDVRKKQLERDGHVKALRKLMKTYKINTFSDNGMQANIFRPKGRASSSIDVHEFRKRVTDDEFMDSVKVMKAEAEKVLPTKELAEITEVTPAVLGEETIEVVKIEIK